MMAYTKTCAHCGKMLIAHEQTICNKCMRDALQGNEINPRRFKRSINNIWKRIIEWRQEKGR